MNIWECLQFTFVFKKGGNQNQCHLLQQSQLTVPLTNCQHTHIQKYNYRITKERN